MAYTTAQLVTAYTNANLGKAPDAATTLTLDAYATQSQTGGLSDAAALANTLKLVNSTTAVAIQTYQFFTGAAPSAAGLDYLVDSTTNTNDLNDAYYSKFAQENRFINFSINLATGSGAGASAFAAAYTGVSYQQTVATAYDKIIGNAVATAAGVDVAAAVAYLSRQANIDYLTAFVKANTPFTATADIELAVKAALIGTILNAATVSGLGGYATATTAMINDLSDGVLSTDNAAGVNLFTAYPSSGIAGSTVALTTGVDAVVGTANNDTINGIITTFTNLDSIDGAGGVDTLNLVQSAAAAYDVTAVLGATVKNVENVNVTGLGTVTANTTSWTGVTALNTTSVGGATVTGAGTTAIAVTDSALGAGAVSVNGGSTVAVTTATTGNGTITVGGTTAPAGAVTVKASIGAADGTTQGAIAVTGGSSVSITQTATNAVNTDNTLGAVTVTGSSATTSVSVSQTAAATKGASAAGVIAGNVTIADANGAHATKAGTISSVTVANAGTVGVTSNSLTALNLSGTVGATTVTTGAGATATALALGLGKGSTGAITLATSYKTVDITASGANTVADISATAATALNVAGSAVVTLTANAGLTAVTKATVSGSAGLSANLTTLTALTKVDTTATTGATTVTVDATKVAFAGGAGADKVTLSGALASGGSVSLGDGADSLLGATAIITSATTVVDGGAGTDTVSSTLINAGNGSMFKNFEVLGLGGNTLDVSLLTGSAISSLELVAGGGGTFTGVTKAQGLTVTGSSGSATTLTFSDVSGSADAYAISFNASTSGTSGSPTTVAAGTVSIAGIENVSIASGSAAGVNVNTIALTDAAARTLTITGSQAATVTFVGGFGTVGTNGLSSIDASAATGIINLNTTNAGIATTGLTVSTGSGADVLTLASAATVSTGAGNDTVTLGGASTVDLGAGNDTVTGGAFASTFTGGAGTDTYVLSTSLGAANMNTIADFAIGDKITFANQGTETYAATKLNVNAATTLTDALNIAAAGDGSLNGAISWFQYGGNTYIVQDNSAGAAFGAGDIVVKLTGLIDLSTATGAGTNTITLA